MQGAHLDPGAILGGPRQGVGGIVSSPCLGQAESQRRESREAMALDETIIGGRYLKSDQRERFKRGPVEAKKLALESIPGYEKARERSGLSVSLNARQDY